MKKIRHPLKVLVYGLTLSALFFTACEESSSTGNNPTNDPQNPKDTTEIATPPQETPTPDNRKVLYLQGVYATSNDDLVDNIFDEEASTVWKTKKGAGPDEGIMLYFQNGVDIEKVQIDQAKGSEFAEVKAFSFYGNGALIGESRQGATFQNLEDYETRGAYQAFFIRIGATDQASEVEVNEVDKNGVVLKFSKNHAVGISGIKIWNAQGEEYRLVPPRKVAATISASSTLEPALAYSTSKLFDTRKEFAWVEGADGYGEGEQLNFQLQEDVNIDKIQIWNGYQRSPSHFKSNTRVKGFSLGETGSKSYDYTLRDDDAPQKIDLKVGVKSRNFEMKFNSVYQGRSYKDLAVSELLFFENDKPLQLVVEDNSAQKEIVEKAKNTVLEPLLDARIANDMEYPVSGFLAQRSIILRSDGTFVMYLMETENADDELDMVSFISIADGNWEILSANANKAEIKIFGKLLDASAIEAYYGGLNEQAEFVKIFKDNLTINNNLITGEKILDEIVIR